MSRWKISAIVFTFISFGAIAEVHKTLTAESSPPGNRSGLLPSVVALIVILAITLLLWRKARKKTW